MPKQKIVIEIESDDEKNIGDFREEAFQKIRQGVLVVAESGAAGTYSLAVTNS